jgi:hypothetical protein
MNRGAPLHEKICGIFIEKYGIYRRLTSLEKYLPHFHCGIGN